MVSNFLLGDATNNLGYAQRTVSFKQTDINSKVIGFTGAGTDVPNPSSSVSHSHTNKNGQNTSVGIRTTDSAGGEQYLQSNDNIIGALKEWAIVCKAIETGDQILLFRKGGIMEFRKGFELKFKNFFLFPTFEHQARESVRPEYQATLDKLEKENNANNNESASNNNNITEISSFVEITHFKEVPNLDSLKELEQFQIWTEDYLKMRFNYNPKKPLYMLLLRAYKLDKPIQMVNKPQWVGCKSWIQIDSSDQDLSAYFENNLPDNPLDYLRSISKPCIDDDKFNRLSEKVRSVI